MNRQDNIVVMGGSFNPPTVAHLKLIRAALDALHGRTGYFSPVSYAYLKRKMVKAGSGHLCIPDGARLEMLRAMAAGDSRLKIYEGDLREPFAVTVKTLTLIRERRPGAKVWLLAGADKLALLETLQRKQGLLRDFGAVLFARGGDLDAEMAACPNLWAFRDSIAVVEPPAGIEGISSTAVRAHLFEPDAVADMLHPAVLPLVSALRAEDFPGEVLKFRDEYAFLGGAFPAAFTYDGLVWQCAETAFQASKSDDPAERRRFSRLSADNARQKGGRMTPRPGWEAARPEIMGAILRAQYAQNPDLRARLLATGDLRLINGTNKDRYWGMNLSTWEGENHLGRLLMALREELSKGEQKGNEIQQRDAH